jgi:hypothetical protein
MPKATSITKKKGRKVEHLTEANVRAREEALSAWVSAIADGQTQRGAAVPLLAKYGVTYGQLLGWCERDPERWGKALDVALATKVERVERELRRIATGEIEDPAIARAQTAAATWLLSKWKRDEYGDKQTTELTGKDGGPVQTQAEVVRYELRVPVSPMLLEDDESGPSDDSSDP